MMMTTIVRQWPNKQTNSNIEHDRNCVVHANKGEKEGVDIKNKVGKEMEK